MSDPNFIQALFFSIAWILTVIFFMYISLKFVTNRFNVHPAWIWAMTPINLVWVAVSMILADATFFIIEKIFKFL